MVFYKYHRQTIGRRPEFTISSDLPILYRHSRDYKMAYKESRKVKTLADFIEDVEIIGISVIFENVIVG